MPALGTEILKTSDCVLRTTATERGQLSDNGIPLCGGNWSIKNSLSKSWSVISKDGLSETKVGFKM